MSRLQIELQNTWKKAAYKKMVAANDPEEVITMKQFSSYFNKAIRYLHDNSRRPLERQLYSDESIGLLSSFFRNENRIVSNNDNKAIKNVIDALTDEYQNQFLKNRNITKMPSFWAVAIPQ